MIHRGQLHHKFWLLLPVLRLRLLSHMATRWQCCSIIEFMLTYLVLQEKERRMERRRKTESRDRKKERDFFFCSLCSPSCSLAARRHLTLTLFVPTTPKVNDFTHYCKWCLIFTLSHRCNEYSRLLLLSDCPEVRLYVKMT